jgi:dTDP-4-dehydrorhamnose reductase
LAYRLCTRAEVDICSDSSISAALRDGKPWAVVNTAGYVRVDDAEREALRCYRENTIGPRLLASACSRYGLPFVTFSSDLVFDGSQPVPYAERQQVGPLNVYGESKVRAEREVLRAHGEALVIRTSAFFGPWDRHNFLTCALARLGSGDEFVAIDDVTVSPTFIPHLVDACLDLLIDRARGVWHLANQGAVTWAELAFRCARLAEVSTRGLRRASVASLRLPARRPVNSALTSERGLLLPPLEQALESFVSSRR